MTRRRLCGSCLTRRRRLGRQAPIRQPTVVTNEAYCAPMRLYQLERLAQTWNIHRLLDFGRPAAQGLTHFNHGSRARFAYGRTSLKARCAQERSMILATQDASFRPVGSSHRLILAIVDRDSVEMLCPVARPYCLATLLPNLEVK